LPARLVRKSQGVSPSFLQGCPWTQQADVALRLPRGTCCWRRMLSIAVVLHDVP